ncbi:hypothetical protein JST97_13955 [bacterium]|nr:hypothetical protein [bacterium]
MKKLALLQLAVLVAVSPHARGWGLKKELLNPSIGRLCLTYKALHSRVLRFRLVQDQESRRLFPPEQMRAEINSALALWSAPMGSLRWRESTGACDLRIEFGPTPAGDTSNGAFTAVDKDCLVVRINRDYVWRERRGLPGNANGDYRWEPFPGLAQLTPNLTVDALAQQRGVAHSRVFWTSYRAFVHEFGHAFGLADTNELLTSQSSPDLCSPGPQPDSVMKTSNYFYLTPDDLEGLRQARKLLRERISVTRLPLVTPSRREPEALEAFSSAEIGSEEWAPRVTNTR